MVLVLCLALLLLAAPAAQAGSWQRPVDGEALRSFALGSNPYARGQHRGVDLAAATGSPVRSACAGRVSFAGRVPGGGLTVSVRCGSLIATLQQLGTIAVRRGQGVMPGMRVGVVGRSIDPRTRRPHVHLGARVAASGRYVDPLTLIGGARPLVPALPPARAPRVVPFARPPAGGPRFAPPGRAPVPVALGRAPAPAPMSRAPALVPPGPAPTGASAADQHGRSPGIPWLVWVGMTIVAASLPIGGLLHVRRRRRVQPARHAATAR